jgi:hypothetical protein
MILLKLKGTKFRKFLKSFMTQEKNASLLLLNVVKKSKSTFVNIGAFSSEEEFVYGDAAWATKWIKDEVEAFNEVLTG